jgi:holo-[acyl-carrier protein] synthase
MKALGTGLRDGISWHDIETVNDRMGKPELILTGRAMELFLEQGLSRAFLSLAHDGGSAIATVVLEKS